MNTNYSRYAWLIKKMENDTTSGNMQFNYSWESSKYNWNSLWIIVKLLKGV